MANSLKRAVGLDTKIGWCIALALLAFALPASYLAPAGSWLNQTADLGMLYEHDPGGYYLVNTHQLSSRLFNGHPGLPLEITLYLVQRVYYFFGSQGTPLTFTEFIARHLDTTFFLAKATITLTHLLSLLLFGCLLRRLLAAERARAFALAVYATSFPVLYYISKISPEPFAMVFFSLTFLALFRAEEKKSTIGAMLAGASAVAGVYSKLHLLFLLPVVGLGYLVMQKSTRRATAFAAGGSLMALAFAPIFSWSLFFAEWKSLAPNQQHAGLIQNLRAIALTDWVPAHSFSGLYFYLELGLIAASLLGAVAYVKGVPEHRKRIAALLLVVAGSLAAFVFRVSVMHNFASFHYLFPASALGALFMGYLWDQHLRELSPRGNAVAIALGIVILHQSSFWTVADSRARDIVQYRRFHAPYFTALRGLAIGERVGIVTHGQTFLPHAVGGLAYMGDGGKLLAAYRDLFLPVDGPPATYLKELARAGVTRVISIGDGKPPLRLDIPQRSQLGQVP